MTQNGSGSRRRTYPPASRARKITPIVFWASWRPWPRAIAAADAVWASLKPRLSRCGFALRKHPHDRRASAGTPRPKATTGDTNIGMTTFCSTVSQETVTPAAIAAPTRPPMRACEEDDGRPKYQVMRFQLMAPSSPAMTITRPWAPVPGSMVSETVVATFWPEERANEVHDRGQRERHARGQRPRRHRGGDGVGGIVEAVGVVEGERDDDDRDDDREVHEAVLGLP